MIVSLPPKAFFYQGIDNEKDIEGLSVCQNIVIDTGLFHIKRESFVTTEGEDLKLCGYIYKHTHAYIDTP